MNGLERKTHVYCAPDSMHFRFGVVGEHGAVELQFRVLTGDAIHELLDRVGAAGLEKHSRTPFEYSDKSKPDHADCWLIGGPCWHDGTSLWASEYWMPNFQRLGTEWLWPRLEQQYADEFCKAPAEPDL